MALDQNIVNLAKAIRQIETGNRPIQGASGELASRYQYMPETWKATAKKYLGNENAELTLENENKATYLKLKEWKDSGYNPAQIASMWNSGSPEWEGKIGTNKKGVKYNVPSYVNKVYAEYQKQKAINPPQEKSITPEITPVQPYKGGSGIMSGLSSLTQKGFEKYAELPVVKQAGQVVGGVVGGLGGIIGGLLGGVAETGRQIYRGVKGEEVDLSQIPKTAKEVGVQTAEAGYQMGAGGATMPPLGLLGRVPNAIVAATQLYEGAKNIKEAAKTGDALQGTEGATQLAMGLLGGKYSIKSGKQGILINPKVSSQIKSELVETGITKEPSVKATETYRNILKPTAGEIKNIEVRKGSDINDSYKFMADKGVIIDKTTDNKVNTTEAIAKLRNDMEVPSNQLNKILESDTKTKFNLLETIRKIDKEIDNENISAMEKQQKKADVHDILIEEIRARNNNPIVDGSNYNKIKQNMWKMGYNALRPTANKTARKIGYTIKEDINKAYKDKGIQKLNEELSKYATAIQLLENAHGRVISGGMLGRGVARGIGAVAGATTKVPIVGPLIGERAGAAISEYMTSPKRLTTKYSNIAQQKLPPSILGKVKKIKPGLTIEDVSKITGYHITRSKRILKKIEEEGFNLKSFGQRSGAKEAGDPIGVYFFPDESFKSIEGWKDLVKSVGVIERELSLKKPFEFKTQQDLQKYVNEIINPAHRSEGVQFKNFQEYANYRADLNTKFNSSKAITQELQRQGYDSIIDKNGIYSVASFKAQGINAKEPQIIVLDTNILKKNVNSKVVSEQSLFQEAKKYKSAEEFIKKQGISAYHGTSRRAAQAIEKTGFKTSWTKFGDGIYFGKTSKDAYGFDGAVIESKIPNNLLKLKEYDKEDALYELANVAEKELRRQGISKNKITKLFSADEDELGNIAKDILKNKYDGVIWSDDVFIVWNTDAIKTKSQLIDIWNKANSQKDIIKKEGLISKINIAPKNQVISKNFNIPEVIEKKINKTPSGGIYVYRTEDLGLTYKKTRLYGNGGYFAINKKDAAQLSSIFEDHEGRIHKIPKSQINKDLLDTIDSYEVSPETKIMSIEMRLDKDRDILRYYDMQTNKEISKREQIKEYVLSKGYDGVILKNILRDDVDQLVLYKGKLKQPKLDSQKGATTPEALVKGGLLMTGAGLLGSQALKATPGGGKAEKELENKQTPIAEVKLKDGKIINTQNISDKQYQEILKAQEQKKEQIKLPKFVPQKYEKSIIDNAKKYNVSPNLISAIINVENRDWNEKLKEIGNKFSTSIGLGQINDATYKDIQKIVGKFDRTNGSETIKAIAAWLENISKRIKSTKELDIANAYNQGVSGHNQGRRNRDYINKVSKYLKD